MAFLTNLKSRIHQRAASVLLKKIMLSQDRWGLSLRVNFVSLASTLIEQTWQKTPAACDWDTGARPHNITIVAISLMHGIILHNNPNNLEDVERRRLFLMSLDAVFSDITKNAHSYPLTHVDQEMLAVAKNVYTSATTEEFVTTLTQEIDVISNKAWDNWYRHFVKKTSELNSKIRIDEYGMSIIDLMNHKPFKKAFYDGISPETVAIMFNQK